MFGINSGFFMGRLTRDVELRTNANGNTYCFFTLAVDYPDDTPKDGEKKPRDTDFINFSASGGVASAIAKRGKKGRWLLVWNAEMRKKTNTVEKNGVTHTYHDVEFRVVRGCFRGPFIEAIPEKDESAQPAANYAQPAPAAAPQAYSPAADSYGGYPGADLSEAEDYSDLDAGNLMTEELPY